jgi:hypothetical protein
MHGFMNVLLYDFTIFYTSREIVYTTNLPLILKQIHINAGCSSMSSFILIALKNNLYLRLEIISFIKFYLNFGVCVYNIGSTQNDMSLYERKHRYDRLKQTFSITQKLLKTTRNPGRDIVVYGDRKQVSVYRFS